jgi:hypothetical protein
MGRHLVAVVRHPVAVVRHSVAVVRHSVAVVRHPVAVVRHSVAVVDTRWQFPFFCDGNVFCLTVSSFQKTWLSPPLR